MSKLAIFICGPTAVGKTSVAIEIAQWLQTEIISFDSRQFFKELEIGAAPPSPQELQYVKHHFIGNLSIADDYNAGDFERDALQLLDHLFQSHQQIVLVGGSGLYMKALTEGFDEMPAIKEGLRESLARELEEKGLESLASELQQKDPEYAALADLQNPQRVIRALEVIRSTGKKYSNFRQDKRAERSFEILKIGLNMPREKLYKRINLRVDKMMDAGLEKEVKTLLPFKDKNAMQTVGYREFLPYFKGDISLDEAIAEVKKNSRRYGKRQLTWFRRDEDIHWFDPQNLEAIKDFIESKMGTSPNHL